MAILMKTRLLKHKILLAVAALVIGSGLVVLMVVSDQYGRSLREAAILQGRYLCRTLSSEAGDIIRLNDPAALNQLLIEHRSINPNIAYLFIVRDGEILAHTFGTRFPLEFIQAQAGGAGSGDHQLIDTSMGERYLDFAWPVQEGRVGTLHLGLSDAAIRAQLADLRIRMILITLLVLLVALVFSLLCVGRITRPLKRLADAAGKVNADHLDIEAPVDALDEVGVLSQAFNRMLARLREDSRRLEANRAELDRAYAQTRVAFEILKKIGSQTALKDVCACLFDHFREIVPCSHLALLVFSPDRQAFHLYANNRLERVVRAAVKDFHAELAGLEGTTFLAGSEIPEELLPGAFHAAKQLALFPFRHEGRLMGALMVACPGRCACNPKELTVIDLLLQESAGVVQRIVQQENRMLGAAGSEQGLSEYAGLVGKAAQMRALYALIDDIAPSDATILIQGESGTGKELAARAIHDRSHRRDGPFVVINCSAYPASLLESELFGHEKGAFTGAIRQKAGRFEQADGGTVFLDEIGEIPASAQVRLLRILQTQKYERVGGEKTLSVNARTISATNRDLLSRVKSGDFREDLFYRLNVIPIHLPPLRERRNDIPLLARHFLARFAGEQGKVINDFSSGAMALLLAYDWPGNVREIENAVEHAVVLAKQKAIAAADLPAAIRQADQAAIAGQGRIMAANESKLLQDVLDACRWNKKETARRLGISRNTLYRKIKKYGIHPPVGL